MWLNVAKRSIPTYSNTPQLPQLPTACLPASAPTAPSHCRHCEQLQEPMPRKNPGAKAAVQVPRGPGPRGIRLGDSGFLSLPKRMCSFFLLCRIKSVHSRDELAVNCMNTTLNFLQTHFGSKPVDNLCHWLVSSFGF